MKHIVLMMRNYYPYYSAVGVCLKNVAENLSPGNKITIICEKTDLDDADKEIYNGQNIIRIISKSTKYRKRLLKLKGSSNLFVKYFGSLLNISYRTMEYLKFILSKYSIQRELIDDYYKALESINDPIDIIVPSCMPFETILAATMFREKNKQIEVIPFLFDKFAENGTLHRSRLNKRVKMKYNLYLEEKAFEKSQRILFTPSWEEHLKKNFPLMDYKFKPVEHPLLKKIEYNELDTIDKNEMSVVYTGTVLKNSRNPEPTLKIIEKIIPICPELKVHFFAMGNATEIIKDFEKKNKNNITFHGQVKTEIAHSAILNSKILLSIGNTDITQTPSKIFEYISSCKPIIHIAVYDTDPVLDILKSYPLACCVCLETDSFEMQVEKVKNFITQKNFNEVLFQDLEKIYFNAIPKFSADLIVNK
ncbi:hypothetical protein ACFSFW_15995 [Fredinandcohnia salidurans]|uniref:Glycosyltransferase n=1 Tax=Fredinandcohnia salidurans TaxID=2595041 RepID=A0ABW4MQI3_9BACI